MMESVSFYSGKLLKSHNREETSSDNSSDSDVPTYTEVQGKVYNHIGVSIANKRVGCSIGLGSVIHMWSVHV